MTSRRVFLSGSAASLLVVPVLPFAQETLKGAPRSSPLVARELQRQLQAAVRTIAGQERGEGARRAAAVLRLWAAHGVAQDYDAQLRDGLARAIKRRGRDTFLYGRPPHHRMREEQKAFGIPDRLLAGHPQIRPELRAKNIDLVLKEGITPALLRSANAFDSLSLRMDRPVTQTVRADDVSDCDGIASWKEWLCDLAEVVCLYATSFPNPVSQDACAAVSGACAAAIVMYWAPCGL
jgi:hypothetical protein